MTQSKSPDFSVASASHPVEPGEDVCSFQHRAVQCPSMHVTQRFGRAEGQMKIIVPSEDEVTEAWRLESEPLWGRFSLYLPLQPCA